MGFWAGYWGTLKSRDIEEPIDIWLHRPLAYLLARAAYPTPISANQITLGSIVFGVAAGSCFLAEFPYHVQIGGVCLFWSAVWDCADGQLARMRGTGSAFGRALDGVADLIVSICAMGGAIYLVWKQFHDPWWVGALAVLLGVVTVNTGASHTGAYDLYKNVYLRMTKPGYSEAEDIADAEARYAANPPRTWVEKVGRFFYYIHVKAQRARMREFDPGLADFGDFPEYSEELAARYREMALPTMKLWRGWFGFGSLVFGVSLFCVLDQIALYLLLRLVLLNAFYYFYMRPRQRRLTLSLVEQGILPKRRISEA